MVRVLKERRTGNEKAFTMPNECPVCNETVIRPPGEAIRRCVNINCPAQIKGRIEHFASKRAMDIDGLGEKLVEQMVDRGVINDVSDLYYLKKETISCLERMADKSAQNIIDAINTSKRRSLSRFIYALGIRNVGEHISGLISERFADLNGLMSATEEELINIPEVGPEVSSSIVTFFNDSKGYGFIKDSETSESIFVHVNNITEEIKENNVVSFEVEMGQKGPSAIQVKVVR